MAELGMGAACASAALDVFVVMGKTPFVTLLGGGIAALMSIVFYIIA
jgi:hypothetical protein